MKASRCIAILIGIFVASAASALIVVAGGARDSQASQPQVVAAVAPAYPLSAVASNTGGKVTVDLAVGSTGDVESILRSEGHSLLREAAERSAKQWRFAATVASEKSRSVTITFLFTIQPSQAREEDLTAVFFPPYQVEIKHRSFEPEVTR